MQHDLSRGSSCALVVVLTPLLEEVLTKLVLTPLLEEVLLSQAILTPAKKGVLASSNTAVNQC